MSRVHRLGVQKRAKLGKRVCFWYSVKFWKEHGGQIKKNACKNAYLGFIFTPEKYVFRMCFEGPFTRMISSLKYKCPLGEKSLHSFIDIEYNKSLDRRRACFEDELNGGSNNIVQSNKSV